MRWLGECVSRAGSRASPIAALLLAGCALMPAELNFSPIYRHRLAEDGSVLELDALWPIVHYERTPTGGDDMRLRPLWRHVSESTYDEHQFLWPFGRIRNDATESFSRLFPLWWHRRRLNEHDQVETDWFALFPFLWGGTREDGRENYFGFMPLYGDLRDFLTYDQFQWVLFPLFLHTEKRAASGYHLIWPFISWGGASGERAHSWWRFLPLYGQSVRPGRYAYHSLLWPFLHWSVDNLDTDDPIHSFAFFPLWTRQWSEKGKYSTWSFLWPFFRGVTIEGQTSKVDLLWPIYRDYDDKKLRKPIRQWWLWPFYARTETDDQRAISMIWPIFWWREYEDPEGTQRQFWALPFFWNVRRERDDGTRDDFVKVWPLAHWERNHDHTGELAVLSPWPWRQGNAYGIDEAYGWMWTLAKQRQRAADDTAFATVLELFTTRTRKQRTQTSVPFLFNYESGPDGATLRLLQLIPIPLGGGKP